ncbi:MAG: ISKra4-like element ISMfu2 family transposase, partial [Phycisphaerales bacterium]
MAKRVIEIPEGLEALGDAFAAMVARVQKTVAASGGGKAVDYGRVEEAIADEAGGIEREAHRSILQALDIDVPAAVIGGVRYVRVGRCAAPYHTLVGSVSIERSLYRQAGTRGGQPEARVVDPVSLRAGVVADGWLPRTARAMAHQVQQGPSREAVATAGEYGRLPYSRSSFERVAHVVGALAVADHQDIEDVLIDAYEIPPEARSVSVSLDRVSVPMEEPRPRPVGRPRKDAPKRPVTRAFRMAYCGTVTLHDDQGAALHTIRYGCMPEGDVLGMRDRLVADVATLLTKQPLDIALLCDGAPEMWGLLDEWFLAEPFTGMPVHRLVDLHHVMEKLGAAARGLDGPAQPGARLTRWRLALLNRRTAATEILEELVASGRDEGPGEDHPVHAAITYLRSNSEVADRMNYA